MWGTVHRNNKTNLLFKTMFSEKKKEVKWGRGLLPFVSTLT